MPKTKDRTLNPATAQLRSDKAKALRKGKAAVLAQRTERYASRNPSRLESTIESLKALKESQGGTLGLREEKQLRDAEVDLGRVRRAREVLGQRAPTFGGRGGSSGVKRGKGEGSGRVAYGGLGKRGRDEQGMEMEMEMEGPSSGSDTDESVRRIPWPRDTPPPIPRQHQHQHQRPLNRTPPPSATNANSEPLGAGRRFPDRTDTHSARNGDEDVVPRTSLPAKPTPAPTPTLVTKTTYESAPQVRDLRKEATERFVPGAVRKKIEAAKGKGGEVLEEEELERLEREGYGGAGGVGGVVVDGGDLDEVEREGRRLEEEEERFRREGRRLEEEEERFRREMEMEMEIGEDGDEEVKGEREGGQAPRGVELDEVEDEDS
ncbi:hypothetical protein N7G274_004460 [Stereocaulon virgatum]|uniref:Wbp11/ELF5/Saf1 N-terminal domain-containing protein n=1 Tax=Stereocaulon virgatum TaxID=373712 RepID=A0ABR4AB78_9LECA